uniref:Uncharacterized protein n=1 Tax=Anguilla anguilla TaxID=7936 RepID=A0A0E9RH82_ANGAN
MRGSNRTAVNHTAIRRNPSSCSILCFVLPLTTSLPMILASIT